MNLSLFSGQSFYSSFLDVFLDLTLDLFCFVFSFSPVSGGMSTFPDLSSTHQDGIGKYNEHMTLL